MRSSVTREISVSQFQMANFDILGTEVNAMLQQLPAADTIYIIVEESE